MPTQFPTTNDNFPNLSNYDAVNSAAAIGNLNDAVEAIETHVASILKTAELTFTETGAGTYTGSVDLPAGATVLDIIVSGVALWGAGTSASMDVGDGTDPDGFFTAINLKATDLLAGENISFDNAGGKAGAYIADSQANQRYSAAARTISAVAVSVGAGLTGRTRVLVLYTLPQTSTAAVKT